MYAPSVSTTSASSTPGHLHVGVGAVARRQCSSPAAGRRAAAAGLETGRAARSRRRRSIPARAARRPAPRSCGARRRGWRSCSVSQSATRASSRTPAGPRRARRPRAAAAAAASGQSGERSTRRRSAAGCPSWLAPFARLGTPLRRLPFTSIVGILHKMCERQEAAIARRRAGGRVKLPHGRDGETAQHRRRLLRDPRAAGPALVAAPLRDRGSRRPDRAGDAELHREGRALSERGPRAAPRRLSARGSRNRCSRCCGATACVYAVTREIDRAFQAAPGGRRRRGRCARGTAQPRHGGACPTTAAGSRRTAGGASSGATASGVGARRARRARSTGASRRPCTPRPRRAARRQGTAQGPASAGRRESRSGAPWRASSWASSRRASSIGRVARRRRPERICAITT